MAARRPPRRAAIDPTDAFWTSFNARNKGRAATPDPVTGEAMTDLERALNTFMEHKQERPPRPLPRGFRDHRLEGALQPWRECHLHHDTLLLYDDRADTVTLYLVVDHDQMKGPRAKKLAKQLRELVAKQAKKIPD